MRLRVFSQTSKRGVSEYGIEEENRDYRDSPRPDVRERLCGLIPRIEAMARQELGENFISLKAWDNGEEWILLSVKQGTSSDKKFPFRDLCGWINLCDSEPQ